MTLVAAAAGEASIGDERDNVKARYCLGGRFRRRWHCLRHVAADVRQPPDLGFDVVARMEYGIHAGTARE